MSVEQCSGCQSPCPPGARFCPFCGRTLIIAETDAPSNPSVAPGAPKDGKRPHLVVAADGTAPYTSIASALEEATDGDRITVLPGTYTAPLIVSRDVEIVGEGPDGSVTISVVDDHTVVLTAPHAVLRNLRIRLRTTIEGDEPPEYYGVAVYAGTAEIIECDIQATVRSGIQVSGPQSTALMRKSTLHDCARAGAFVCEQAKLIIDNCVIHGNGTSGIMAKGAAQFEVQGCSIQSSSGHGLMVAERASGTVGGCDISGGDWGALIAGGGHVTIGETNFHDLKVAGVGIQAATARITQCHITHSGSYGVAVSHDAAEATLEGCIISEQTDAACAVEQNAHAVLQECDLGAGTGAGIRVMSGAIVTLGQCHVHHYTYPGITVQGGRATLLTCEVTENGGNGIYGTAGSSVEVRDSTVQRNDGVGVSMDTKSHAILINCDIGRNGFSSQGYSQVWAGNGSSVACRQCRIHDGKTYGLTIRQQSHGQIEDCDITGNGSGGVWIGEESDPMIRWCRINDNSGFGIEADRNSPATIENCDLTGNKSGAWFLGLFRNKVKKSGNKTESWTADKRRS